MATRKKSTSKARKATPTKTKRAASVAKSAKKRVASPASSARVKKRAALAKTSATARRARKVAAAARTGKKLAGVKRKRKISGVVASVAIRKSAKARAKVVGRTAAKPRKLDKSKKTASRAKAARTVAVKTPAKQVAAKLRSKNGREDKRPRPLARNAPTPVSVLKAAPLSKAAPAEPRQDAAAASVVAAPAAKAPPLAKPAKPPVARESAPPAAKPPKPVGQRQGFKLNEFVVYPAHGVGQIVALEDQEVAGFKLELFVISFAKDKMTLRVPTSKVAGVGMRKISDADTARRSLEILTGRARVKRTMWSRRAQEYETKINSGDINAIAEVVRDLYRSEAQPEQSYSERQLYEAALDRMVREIAAVQKSNEIDALKTVEAQLQKGQNRGPKSAEAPGEAAGETEIEEAA